MPKFINAPPYVVFLTLKCRRLFRLFIHVSCCVWIFFVISMSGPLKLNSLCVLDTCMQAEQWVKNMSKSSEDESTKVILKARPPRSVSAPSCDHVHGKNAKLHNYY